MTAALPCRHHWILEIANGPTSPGVCCLCGDKKEFKNSITEPDRRGVQILATMKKSDNQDAPSARGWHQA